MSKAIDLIFLSGIILIGDVLNFTNGLPHGIYERAGRFIECAATLKMSEKAIGTARKGGSYFKRIMLFSIPLMLTGILQAFYNAADLIVVGRFDGESALAAVGATGSLTSLILGTFTGLAVGSGVSVAHAVGAKNDKDISEILHTSVIVASVLGAAVAVIGFFLAPEILVLMDTPADVLDKASLYVKIIFIGSPFSMLYNYCAYMLRSSGDSKRPLIFLIISGMVNVVLNVIFVAVFHMGVAGVAIATIVSQLVSSVLILRHFIRLDGPLHFSFKHLKISKSKLKKILVIGIPSGIQGSLFSLSNVIIQSSINSFGSTVMAGSTAASNIEGFYYQAYHAFYDSTLTFVGQSVGAKKFKEIKKIIMSTVLCLLASGAVLISIALIFKHTFIGFYIVDSPAAYDAASARYFLVIFQVMCGFMEMSSGALRGMGRSVLSSVISLLFACALRIVWIATVFKVWNTPMCVYITYPISWILTAAVSFVFVVFAVRKEIKLQKILSVNESIAVEV